MTSQVKIYNMALANMYHAQTISSVSEDSVEADALNVNWDEAVELTLEDAPWGFAKKRVLLAIVTDETATDWGYVYAYPSDCIKARYILGAARTAPDPPIPFERSVTADGDTQLLLSDIADAELVYTMRITNLAMFSASFAEVLAWKLAAMSAGAITGKRVRALDAIEMHRIVLARAAASVASEDTKDEQPASAFERARV